MNALFIPYLQQDEINFHVKIFMLADSNALNIPDEIFQSLYGYQLWNIQENL